MSEMAHHSWAGNIARGMTMCVLSNGGGVGIGKAYNGGFGLVLDGSKHIDEVIRSALDWDVFGGIARRAWARNPGAIETMNAWNLRSNGHVLLPYLVEDSLLKYISSSV
jgi:urocanate hydratase